MLTVYGNGTALSMCEEASTGLYTVVYDATPGSSAYDYDSCYGVVVQIVQLQ